MSYYSDFNFNLNKIDPESVTDIEKVEDNDSIKQSIKNILFTQKGEAFFDPLFGSGIRKLLFEKMSPVTKYLLKNEIRTALENYEPRITINNIIIEEDFDFQTYDVYIEYLINKLDMSGIANVTLKIQGI